jgi:OPA family glycerol-3-phosphate transporter-like MFS transporter
MDKLTQEIVPIFVLIAVIVVVVARLPRVDVGHTPGFLRRRMLNWLPLGLTYAFLYMGRYNMTVLKIVGGVSQRDFGDIDGLGALVYGVAFLVNGPLADRIGGRRTILIAAGGSLAANALIGLLWQTGAIDGHSKTALTALFVLNMYFQSFGAVSIVKVNASWFHLRERGTFGGIFGILISLGLYFAFDWGGAIADAGCPACRAHPLGPVGTPPALGSEGLAWLFLVPAAILAVFWALSFLWVRDTPSQAGLRDFDVGDASSGQVETREPAVRVIFRLLKNPVILTIALIELCSGFLRQGITKWSNDFAGSTGSGTYITRHWGMVSCIAGITGGMVAGVVSDHLFQSRRPPMATVLYLVMLVGAIALIPLLGVPLAVSWIISVMAMAFIGVHGMLSGTASADFGGRLNTGVAVGLIDGFVYLGTAIQDQVYGGALSLLPEKGTEAAKQVANWQAWPVAMVPVAALGLVLSIRIWNARVVRPAAAASSR